MRGIISVVRELAVHRDIVDRALGEAGSTWNDWPEVLSVAQFDERARLSGLLLLLTAPAPRELVAGDALALDRRVVETIERLRRRRLPWDRHSARLAIDLVVERGDFDPQRVAVALRGAEAVCSRGDADTALIDALRRCATWLDQPHDVRWQLPQMRLQVRRVLAASTPPIFLDLSLLAAGDAWAEPARRAARELPADEVAPLVRLLGELGSHVASRSWSRRVAEALQPVPARSLLKAWLQRAADVDAVPRDPAEGSGADARLLAPANEDLVRAAVLATTVLPDSDWVPATLGALAARGAATSKGNALCLKVASAAVEALASRGQRADRVVLAQLFDDLSRRDLVKRIGAILGEDEQAAARDAQLRYDKAAAVRRKADPAPRRARAALDVLIRRHLGALLRAHGFCASGRTWRRMHSDRVDVIAIGSGESRLQVSYGTRFDAVHPPGERFPVERSRVYDHHLDVREFAGFAADETGVLECATQLSDVVLPFLETLGRYELVVAHLRTRASGAPHRGSSDVSPHDRGVIGMLALAAADRATAVEYLEQRSAFAEQAHESHEADRRFWRDQLEAAIRLR